MDAIRNMLKGRSVSAAIDFAADRTRLLVQDGARGHAMELPGADLAQGVRDSVIDALRQRVCERRLRDGRSRVSIAASCFRCEMATLPAMTDTELASSARFEAMDRFGVEPTDAVIRHLPLAGSARGAGRQVLLLALPVGTARHAAEAVMAAGLRLDSLEHAAIAGLRAATAMDAGMATGTVAWLHVEPRVASLLVQQDGDLRFMRDFEGEWAVAPRTQTRTRVSMRKDDDGSIPLAPVDDEDENWRWSCLAEEVLCSLRQAGDRESWPSRLMVAGGPADASLCDALGGVCGLDASLAACAQWGAGVDGTRDHAWAAAMGAGLPAASDAARRAA